MYIYIYIYLQFANIVGKSPGSVSGPHLEVPGSWPRLCGLTRKALVLGDTAASAFLYTRSSPT